MSGTWGAPASTLGVTVPAITTVSANAWWIFLTCDNVPALGSGSVPAGWTQRFRATSGFSITQHQINSILVATPGLQSATSFSRTSSGGNHISIPLALKPAAAAGAAFVPRVIAAY